MSTPVSIAVPAVPATAISFATALTYQMKGLLAAEMALNAPPISDPDAFQEVSRMEMDIDTLYGGYADDASVPGLSAASQADLQARLDSLKNAIENSNDTSDGIVAASQLLWAFSPQASS